MCAILFKRKLCAFSEIYTQNQQNHSLNHLEERFMKNNENRMNIEENAGGKFANCSQDVKTIIMQSRLARRRRGLKGAKFGKKVGCAMLVSVGVIGTLLSLSGCSASPIAASANVAHSPNADSNTPSNQLTQLNQLIDSNETEDKNAVVEYERHAVIESRMIGNNTKTIRQHMTGVDCKLTQNGAYCVVLSRAGDLSITYIGHKPTLKHIQFLDCFSEEECAVKYPHTMDEYLDMNTLPPYSKLDQVRIDVE